MTHFYTAHIEPIDPLLFGDNRSARAGVDHVQLDQDPSPVAIHGSLGRFIWDHSPGGFPPSLGTRVDDILDPGASTVAELLGFSLCDADSRLWFPKPLHLRCRRTYSAHRVKRYFTHDIITPMPPQGVTSAPFTQLLCADSLTDEADESLLISDELLSSVLSSDVPARRADDDVRLPSNLFCSDVRPGIAIDNVTSRTIEGMFFSRPYRRFAEAHTPARGALGSGFTAWLATPGEIPAESREGIGFVGGDRRRARMTLADCPRDEILGSMRDRVVGRCEASKGFLAYLLTPRIANEPFTMAGRQPVSAAIAKPQVASGWNTQRNEPRPMITLEPAGSVYFFEWAAGDDRESIIAENWLASGSHGAAAGFGRTLLGVW